MCREKNGLGTSKRPRIQPRDRGTQRPTEGSVLRLCWNPVKGRHRVKGERTSGPRRHRAVIVVTDKIRRKSLVVTSESQENDPRV